MSWGQLQENFAREMSVLSWYRKSAWLEEKKKNGSQQGYIHADCVQLYMM